MVNFAHLEIFLHDFIDTIGNPACDDLGLLSFDQIYVGDVDLFFLQLVIIFLPRILLDLILVLLEPMIKGCITRTCQPDQCSAPLSSRIIRLAFITSLASSLLSASWSILFGSSACSTFTLYLY